MPVQPNRLGQIQEGCTFAIWNLSWAAFSIFLIVERTQGVTPWH